MGIGINTGMKKSEFPEAFRETSTSFLNEGIDVSRKDLLAAVLAELEKSTGLPRMKVLKRCWMTGAPFPLPWGRKYGLFSETKATQEKRWTLIRTAASWLIQAPI